MIKYKPLWNVLYIGNFIAVYNYKKERGEI